MNTGIGDAVNLAWKLAAVVQGRAGAALLDSYEPERIAYARRLVRLDGSDVSPRGHAFVHRRILARERGAAADTGHFAVPASDPPGLPDALADRDRLPAQPDQRRVGRRIAWRRPAALGRRSRWRQFCAARHAGLAGACLWRGERAASGAGFAHAGCSWPRSRGPTRPAPRAWFATPPTWSGRTAISPWPIRSKALPPWSVSCRGWRSCRERSLPPIVDRAGSFRRRTRVLRRPRCCLAIVRDGGVRQTSFWLDHILSRLPD